LGPGGADDLSKLQERTMQLARRCLPAAVSVAALAAFVATRAERGAAPPSPSTASQAARLAFEANQGQADPAVRFLARGRDHALLLTGTEAKLTLRGRDAGARTRALRMQVLGARASEPLGVDALPSRSNYLIGSDASKWHTGIPHFARVKYERVYPGVDLVFHGSQGQLEYDFVLAPGADPDAIRVAFDGSGALRLDANGDLILPLGGGQLRHRAPHAYQERDGIRSVVPSKYVLVGSHEIGFSVDRAAYDAARPLVIDPVLSFSSYAGGVGQDEAFAVATDAAGNTHVAGRTASAEFPTTNAYDATYGGNICRPDTGAPRTEACPDAFVMKLDASGALVYSTYFGGGDWDEAFGIALDAGGNVYVTGTTRSTDFPTQMPFQPAYAGGDPGLRPHGDAFVAKLDGLGAPVYSTYLGGSGMDAGNAIDVDAQGHAYVVGTTGAGGFPLVNPIDDTHFGGLEDGFVAKLAPAGDALVYSTYLGGSSRMTVPQDVAADAAGAAYVTGSTATTDFPTTPGAFQAAHGGGVCFGSPCVEGFVTKLNAAGSALEYSTYLGGANGSTDSAGIAIDAAGNAYVAGTTRASDFPTTPGAFQPASSGTTCSGNPCAEAFVTKLNASGSALVYSTFLGGTSDEFGLGIAVDGSGSAYVAGATDSVDFPTRRAVQPSLRGGRDVFVTRLNAAGSELVYSTYLGGGDRDAARGVAVGAGPRAHVTGFTWSADFPVQSAFQSTFGGQTDAFVAFVDDPEAVAGRIEQDDRAVSYSGTWYENSLAGHSGGSAVLSAEAGARASLTFNGTGVRCFGYRDEWSGIARVYVDGALAATVDTYASPAQYQAELFAASGLASGSHTLEIEVAGRAGELSGGAWVWVDAFEVSGGPEPSPSPTATPTATPPPGGGRIEQDDAAVSYSGTWYANALAGHSGGSAALSAEAGSRATLSFSGTGVRWLGYRDEWSGVARVYLDGVLAATVDAYASPAQYQAVLFAADGLPSGTHSIAIEVTGAASELSAGPWIWVDAFDVISGPGPSPTPTPTATPPAGGRVEQDGAGVSYTGTWYPNLLAGHSGGSAALSAEAGSRATFTFTGTGVRWVGYRDEWSGIARVYVDGALAATVDAHASPAQYQSVLFSAEGLGSGSHTLAIEVTGASGPASGGAWVWIDAFDVIG
jgi:hypothetical protein